jgi:uncharacterized protein (TIGR00251 family)
MILFGVAHSLEPLPSCPEAVHPPLPFAKPAVVQDSKDGTILTVHVQPKASQTACVGIYGDALKIRVAAPPVDGAANEELVRFLASELAVPLSAVRIESGAGGRHKRVRLNGVTAAHVKTWLIQKGPLRG